MIDIVINGQSANVRNILNVGFRTSFRDRKFSELELNIDTLILVNESKQQIHDWITTYGANVGIPTVIAYETLNFEYYIDLTDNPIFRDYEIEVKIKRRKGKDSFFNITDGLSFELLSSRGVVFPIRQIPYVIVKDNQVELGITLSLALFSVTNAIVQATKDLAAYIADLSSGTIGLSPAMVISAGIKIGLQVAYIAGLVVAGIQLAQQIKELVFPKVRYLNACNVKDLISKGCENIGYTFQSTLLDSITDLVLLPAPLQKENDSIFDNLLDNLDQSFTKGYPTASDTTPTLGLLIDSMLEMFNAKLKVNNGVVQLETKQFLKSLSTLQATPFLNLKDSRQNEYSINSNEAWQRYYIHYQTDFNDLHTLDKFEPTDAEYGNVNVNQLDPDLNLINGNIDVNIPFALGVRKSQYTFIEQRCLNLLNVIDAFTGLNTSANISDRLGVLQISQQFYGTTKLLLCDVNGKQPANYQDILKASALWNNYHAINNNVAPNGKKIFENAEVLMNFSEFSQILSNNYVEVDGDEAEIMEIDFIPNSSKATISYETEFDYNLGKITTFAINE